MIELPPIPEGDRFKDTSLFRPLGAGQKSRLYECWDDAIYEYARTYGDQRAAEAREQMRDECLSLVGICPILRLTQFAWLTQRIKELK